VTSYELALLAAKNKSSYTAVESLIVPGGLIITDKMLDKKICKCNKNDSEF
jgi:hypothetical protein